MTWIICMWMVVIAVMQLLWKSSSSTATFSSFSFSIPFGSCLSVLMLDCPSLPQYPKVSVNNIWTWLTDWLSDGLLLLFWVMREVFHVRHLRFTQHIVGNDFVFNSTKWNPERMFGLRAVYMNTFESKKWKVEGGDAYELFVFQPLPLLSKTSASAHVEWNPVQICKFLHSDCNFLQPWFLILC